jgi:hypothetical protein
MATPSNTASGQKTRTSFNEFARHHTYSPSSHGKRFAWAFHDRGDMLASFTKRQEAMSEIKARITEDMKASMKSGDRPRLETIRLILAALKQKEVDERITLSDAQVLEILNKMLKQRRDSIEQFAAAKRDDLVAKEKAEVEVIQSFMPKGLDNDEINALIAEAITETGASSAKDMGKLMTAVKAKIAGRADMQAVSALVKAKLG